MGAGHVVPLVVALGHVAVPPALDRADAVLRHARTDALQRGSPALSVVSLNVLSPAFARAESYPHIASEQLEWHTRCKQICAQIASCEADVVALQEIRVSTFELDFSPLLELGYAASVQADDKRRPYGCATLYDCSRFLLEREESRSRVQLSTLRDVHSRGKSGERRMYLANVHLQRGSCDEATRLLQLRSLFKHLAEHRAASLGRAPADVGRAAPGECAIICGDFNSGRRTAVYQLMRDGALRTFPPTGKQRRHSDGSPARGRPYKTGFLRMKDAYRAKPPAWGPFEMTHTSGALLDYIWVSDNCEVVASMPCAWRRQDARTLFGRGGAASTSASGRVGLRMHPRARAALPSADGQYASDHLALGCVLQFGVPRRESAESDDRCNDL